MPSQAFAVHALAIVKDVTDFARVGNFLGRIALDQQQVSFKPNPN